MGWDYPKDKYLAIYSVGTILEEKYYWNSDKASHKAVNVTFWLDCMLRIA